MTVLANIEHEKSQIFSRFNELGLTKELCHYETWWGHTYELNGPATDGAYQLIDPDATFSSWISVNTTEFKVTINIGDPLDFAFYGIYSVKHANKNVHEIAELFICHIKGPTRMFVDHADDEPFTILRQASGSLKLQLEPYTMTDEE